MCNYKGQDRPERLTTPIRIVHHIDRVLIGESTDSKRVPRLRGIVNAVREIRGGVLVALRDVGVACRQHK